MMWRGDLKRNIFYLSESFGFIAKRNLPKRGGFFVDEVIYFAKMEMSFLVASSTEELSQTATSLAKRSKACS